MNLPRWLKWFANEVETIELSIVEEEIESLEKKLRSAEDLAEPQTITSLQMFYDSRQKLEQQIMARQQNQVAH